MSVEEEYYINLHVGGKFVHDPHVKYLCGKMVRLKEYPDTMSYFELRKIVKDGLGFNTVNHKEIDLYVGHKIDTAVFVDDESMLTVACGKGEGEGGEVVGSKGGEGEGQGEDGEVAGSKGSEGSGEGGEVTEGLGGEGDDVAVCECGESDRGSDEGVNIAVNEDGESDGGGKEGVREVEGKTSGKGKEIIFDETESESSREQFEAEVPEEVDCKGLNDSVGKEEDGNETEYFDSDDHRSILGSEDDENSDAYRRSRFPTYNSNSASTHFYIGILFKDGDQFKFVICKYLMCCRRELKITRNEPNRVRVKCIAPQKCKWGIFASYSNMARCMQVKDFHKEHNCCVSFKNKMVNLKVIAERFEAIIGDYPKMKPRDIQRREFATLWDYVDELRLKNPGSAIKMAVNRVTPKSLPHFKRFYVCFEALKRGWKEGCCNTGIS
ncbi:hypothetical protein Goshw_009983 [Gossypium schwendimanii]|uniref:Transposase MuDR plant domain-containing protein n=1 Tax=Gossypium schwendimanii TaxID=34291 RepID=A0A7J9N9Z6_GOSSC|nr:hypothetical protein [Gossypium schwendimanii]